MSNNTIDVKALRFPDPLGILALHASAVTFNDHALLFFGPSGAGKSTIRCLLTTYTNMQPLADDAVYLIGSEENTWRVANADNGKAFRGPLSTHEANMLMGPSLKAVFRLFQSSEPYLEQLQDIEIARHLTDAYFEINRSRRLEIKFKKRVFSSVASLSRFVYGYHFYFDKSRQTAFVLLREIESVLQ